MQQYIYNSIITSNCSADPRVNRIIPLGTKVSHNNLDRKMSRDMKINKMQRSKGNKTILVLLCVMCMYVCICNVMWCGLSNCTFHTSM